MANIIDYVKWRGDLELKVSEFNEIDSLILNRFSYFPLDSIMKENEIVSIKELSERLNSVPVENRSIWNVIEILNEMFQEKEK